MPVVATTAEVLDREFLGIRCRLIELAAALDRIARAGGTVIDDPRMSQILASLEILSDSQLDHAQRLQMVFSKES